MEIIQISEIYGVEVLFYISYYEVVPHLMEIAMRIFLKILN